MVSILAVVDNVPVVLSAPFQQRGKVCDTQQHRAVTVVAVVVGMSFLEQATQINLVSFLEHLLARQRYDGRDFARLSGAQELGHPRGETSVSPSLVTKETAQTRETVGRPCPPLCKVFLYERASADSSPLNRRR